MRPRRARAQCRRAAAAPPPPPPPPPPPLPRLLFLALLLAPMLLLSGLPGVVLGARLGPGAIGRMGPAAGDPNVCHSVTGLTREQLDLCRRLPTVAAAALQGLQMAVVECQFQFQWHRWNCSSLSTKGRNPHNSVILQRGFRESAFARAISAAGVAHSVARACASGRLVSCGCDPHTRRAAQAAAAAAAAAAAVADNAAGGGGGGRRSGGGRSRAPPPPPLQPPPPPPPPGSAAAAAWKWGGCSHNIDYGLKFSKMFLDARERAGDMQARVNLHNNQAGRLAVVTNVLQRCKCHGVSGSCELKTCWHAAPPFRVVGDALKERFRTAVLVDQGNLGRSGAPLLAAASPSPASNSLPGARRQRPRPSASPNAGPNGGRARLGGGGGGGRGRRKRLRPTDLLYFQRSPTFCERDPSVDFPGTVGRRCVRGSRGVDGCPSMCCGRGYDERRERRDERCNCRFRWCCSVACDNCTIEEWVTVCK